MKNTDRIAGGSFAPPNRSHKKIALLPKGDQTLWSQIKGGLLPSLFYSAGGSAGGSAGSSGMKSLTADSTALKESIAA